MSEFLNFIRQIGDFSAGFGLIKCLKGMICAMAVLLLIALIHFLNRKRKSWLNLYSFLLLFPLCLMGYSKLFFVGEMFRISNWMYGNIHPGYGYLYFSVAGVALIRFLFRNIRLRCRVKRLPVLEDKALTKEIIARLTAPKSVGRYYLSKVVVYQTKKDISPFSGGIFHPYVVLPKTIVEDWEKEELRIVLFHEILHIRYGHIPMLFFFSLLKIYWWMNPLMYLAERQLKEDMELFCDEKCLYYADTARRTYGALLLKMIALMQNTSRDSVAAFLGKGKSENFNTVKKRMGHLMQVDKKEQRHQKQMAAVIGILLLGITGFILTTSYPRYTALDTLSLHDERGAILIYDTQKLKQAVKINDMKVTVDNEALEALLKEESIEKDFVYLSFGNIQKTPGAGGGGNIALIDIENNYEISYMGIDDWKSRFEQFFLKYLI